MELYVAVDGMGPSIDSLNRRESRQQNLRLQNIKECFFQALSHGELKE